MTRIVTTQYRYKRPPRRAKAAAIEAPAIVRARKPADRSDRSLDPAEEMSSDPTLPANADRKPAIVTARRPRASRFGDVPDMAPEEHKRRGDAAAEMFREMQRLVLKG